MAETLQRTDPDALLASRQRVERGVLTVFLGAAAGVGKTYAMLLAAHERLAAGVDLTIGWVESHGRAETEALLHGLPAVAASRIECPERVFPEMDIDALLARHPALAIVDELAHTNIPGARHTRRYQDVEELLAAGINVYSTLSVQHIESLNDIVARITGVRMRETVPDKVLENAVIKLVDIPPEELLARLREGKVYIPEQAGEELHTFFRPGNLGALRELALRYAASQVDRDVETYMKAHAISGPWPKAERVLVCVGPSPLSLQLIRSAYRLAVSLRGEWIAFHVETPRRPTSRPAREQLARNLRLAEDLGAEVITVTGDDIAEEVLRISAQRNVTQLLIGKPIRGAWGQWLHGAAVVDKIIRRSQGIGIHVIPGRPAPHEPAPPTFKVPRQGLPASLLWTFGMVGVVTVLGKLTESVLGPVNIALAFLLPIMTSALLWGTFCAIGAAIGSIFAFDVLFVSPIFRFTVDDGKYLFAFAMFLIVAIWVGTMASRQQQHLSNLREREKRIRALYGLSQKIAATADLATILAIATKMISEAAGVHTAMLVPDEEGQLQVRASAAPGVAEAGKLITPNDLAVAAWVLENGHMAGRGTETLAGCQALLLPVRTEGKQVGVLAVWPDVTERILPSEQKHLLEAFASLIAIAVNRVRLFEQIRQAYRLEESERLWMALFNSLSHDLRTPLAAITGAVTTLLADGGIYDESSRQELLRAIETEAARLNRLVANLFDMARLKSGKLQLHKEWCDIADIIGIAAGHFPSLAGSRRLSLVVDQEVPLVQADPALLEQVLLNLLDNALKYSRPESEIKIDARRMNDGMVVAISDYGSRIPHKDLARIFDLFYRGRTPENIDGTGVGLAICKAVVEAHGGCIEGRNEEDGRVTFSFTLPLAGEAPTGIPSPKEAAKDGELATPGAGG